MQTLRQNTEVPLERHASTHKEIATQTQGLVISQSVSFCHLDPCVLTANNTSMKARHGAYTVGPGIGKPARRERGCSTPSLRTQESSGR